MPAADTYENPLVRDGQSQENRELEALLPDYVKVDERSRENFMAYAKEYAGLLEYYNDQNEADGTWEEFFNENTDPDQPHYALFLAFTWLFRLLQEDINSITERHLDHYYKEILQLQTKPAEADSVHLLFEIAKNVDSHLLKEGTLLKAGKDDSGKELLYALDQDLVLNKAKVAELKTVFREPRFNEDGTLNNIKSYGMYAAAVADSSDGQGEDQGSEGLQWNLFGESQVDLEEPSMTEASLGFMVASPSLYLQEGHRIIKLGITSMESLYTNFLPYWIADGLTGLSDFTEEMFNLVSDAYHNQTSVEELDEDQKEALKKIIKVSKPKEDEEEGEEALPVEEDEDDDSLLDGYLSLFNETIESAFNTALSNAFIVSFSGDEGWIGPFTVNGEAVSTHHISLELTLEKDQPAISNYSEKVLEANINTTQPVMKVMLNQDAVFRYDFLQSAEIKELIIDVTVTDVKNLTLQSDSATLNADKPFQPFGPLPLLKSNLYVGSAEVFRKKINEFELNIDWSDTPNDFSDHYSAYNDDIGKDKDKKETSELEKAKEENPDISEAALASISAKVANDYPMYTNANFQARMNVLYKGDWEKLIAKSSADIDYDEEVRLFEDDQTATTTLIARSDENKDFWFERESNIQPLTPLDNNSNNGFIRIQLSSPKKGRFEAFGHKAFPTFYTEKIIELTAPEDANAGNGSGSGSTEIKLPNEPYTPLISGLSINYRSKVTVALSNLENEPEQFFHIAPFGLEEKVETEEDNVTLLPSFEHEGTLYVGISDLDPPQNLSLLFQLNEKSVNHEFVGKVETQWSYLSKTGWEDFDEQEILEDNTEFFTRSGIVKFSIPKDIASSHTQLSDGKYWLRVTVQKNVLGVSDAYQIAAQAVTATFVDQDNATSHLSQALAPETIKKFKVNDSKVKKTQQPYASFGGQLEETSEAFYTRVSERLRHKHRAISIWDYERIILEAFPSVYKVKCLNHYNPEAPECQRQLSPGAVTVLVLSKVADENELSKRLAPITNVITLGDIKSHLKSITSPFIAGRNKLFVQNPNYEYLSVQCSVKYRSGFDEGYYKKELETDLKKYFSPWGFDSSLPISFERKVYKSLIINHIEELEYVDFVCCFKLFIATESGDAIEEILDDTYESSDPATILISSNRHFINKVEGDLCNCDEETQESPVTVGTGIGYMIIESTFKVYESNEPES